MSKKNLAIGHSALVRSHIVGIERRLQEGYEQALEEGLPTVADKIAIAQAKVEEAHAALNDVAASLSAAFDDTVSTFSGGDDKPKVPGT